MICSPHDFNPSTLSLMVRNSVKSMLLSHHYELFRNDTEAKNEKYVVKRERYVSILNPPIGHGNLWS